MSSVSLPDGSVLWVYLGGGAKGVITLKAGAGSMKPDNLGGQHLTFASVSVIDGPPPILATQHTIVSGGFFS